MTTPAQILFRKIVLHNRLMEESAVDQLLAEVPEPERAIQRMIKDKVIPIQKANVLFDLYQKQMKKLAQDSPGAQQAAQQEQQQTEEEEETDALGESPVLAAQRQDNERLHPPEGIHPILTKYLIMARKMGATDVHIRAGDVPYVRRAGRLRPFEGESALAAEACERAVYSVLALPDRERFTAEGDFTFCYDGGEMFGRYRTSLLRQISGVHGAFRLIPTRILTPEQLQLPPAVAQLAGRRQGLVLITGPRTSGKTTTLAAMVDQINRTRVARVMTIENPIEFVHSCQKSHVSQCEVGADAESFAAAMRMTLRNAPEVIAVDELSDAETIRMALAAADSGRLVLATAHPPDALRAIEWLIGVFPPAEQGSVRAMLSNALEAVLSQRLMPRADGAALEPAFELLLGTTGIGNLIRKDKIFQLRSVIRENAEAGMIAMDDSLLQLLKAHRIQREDAILAAVEPSRMEVEDE
jgi:twitching motility protein PilT